MTLLMRECEKYTEGREDGRAEGRAYGIIEFALELNYSDDKILSILQKKLDIDIEQAEEHLRRYYDEDL